MTSAPRKPVSGVNQSTASEKSRPERPLVPSVAAAVAAVAALACIFALGIAGLLFYGNPPNWSALVPEVRAITETLEALSYDNLKTPCAAERAQLYAEATDRLNSPAPSWNRLWPKA